MVFKQPTFGTQITDPSLEFNKQKEKADTDRFKQDKIKCINSGGKWDPATNTCSFPLEKTKDPYKIELPEQEQKTKEPLKGSNTKFNEDGTVTFTSDLGTKTVPKEEYRRIIESQQAGFGAGDQEVDLIKTPLGTKQAFRQAQELQGQVGQFGELGVSPTGLDFAEAATTGIVDAIPRALTLAGGAAVAGATAGAFTGPAAPVASPALAAAAAAVTFVGSIASSMKSNMASQRRDTTTAQQRVLDEGKQTMNDWITLAESDPSNRAAYLAEYNKVAAQIDQAYRQMKLDTSRDVAKFETALPNLAEFEAFYSAGGERDVLNRDMQQALITLSPEGYNMLELAYRRQQ